MAFSEFRTLTLAENGYYEFNSKVQTKEKHRLIQFRARAHLTLISDWSLSIQTYCTQKNWKCILLSRVFAVGCRLFAANDYIWDFTELFSHILRKNIHSHILDYLKLLIQFLKVVSVRVSVEKHESEKGTYFNCSRNSFTTSFFSMSAELSAAELEEWAKLLYAESDFSAVFREFEDGDQLSLWLPPLFSSATQSPGEDLRDVPGKGLDVFASFLTASSAASTACCFNWN